ncbi:MAG: Subunit of ADP-glucose pyrophosphorylase [Bacillales bacterium]|jgi:glucose-1-phosphate adenylyltransferase|nr:Subunit of ADP-glucose pyrophosphorylase [Bacillales bacterium]
MVGKRVVAMLLAGGKGSRLNTLTKGIAKPAVPFGGKYRIIDFTLSNCSNSGIDTVGVLTQYEPLELNSYIGIGSAWDLDRTFGGVTVLPPYSEEDSMKWYSGTASAVYQNINFLKKYNPEHVLILSGDHIYKMDYSKMLDYHTENNADVTISVIKVPWEEASRFGIMNTNDKMEVIDFEEKPSLPQSNLASMGIYIFRWEILKDFLQIDNCNENSSHDFGKDVIPELIKSKKRVYAYYFDGYWKDVGTVKSLWEANMDLLYKNRLDLYDPNWKIYSVNPHQPPQYISPTAEIKNSLINEGCIIKGKVNHSVIFQGVTIADNATVIDSVIMPGVSIEEGAVIERAIVPTDYIVKRDAVIRPKDENDIILVGDCEFAINGGA